MTSSTNRTTETKDEFWGTVLQEISFGDFDKSTSNPPQGMSLGTIIYRDQLSIHSQENLLSVYNTAGFCSNRIFKPEDILVMKTWAVNWMSAVVAHSQESTEQPWWSHAHWIYNSPLNPVHGKSELRAPSLKEDNIDDYWNLYLAFQESMYSCRRYRWRQKLLWEDLQKDFTETRNTFFKDCEERYFQLLMRVVASRLVYKIDNIKGN